MCGIIGYIGSREACPILLEGLKKLEYRGYDSAGVSIINSKLDFVKKKGRIKELENSFIPGNLGIAHTRWATHGIPNEVNAHPHFSGKIAVVHNGIIENFLVLKELLVKDGFNFVSDTDSEVLAHLISKFYVNNLEEAVVKALELVEGTFGLAVIHEQEKKIVAARRSSPLIIGVGSNEMFLASDATAILKHTRKVVFLSDNDVAVLNPEGFSVKHLNGEVSNPEVQEIQWDISQIEKKGYKHFMLKEIFEQPESLKTLLSGRLKKDLIKLTVDIPVSLKRIVITACGTSWHSALIGKYLIERICEIPVEVDYASEFRYRDPLLSKDDLFIVVSQSGETADTLAALQEAKKKGCKTLGIVNVVGSTIGREVDSGIYLHAGPEIGVASTKAFTSQVTSLILLALFLKQENGLKIHSRIISELERLPGLVAETLKVKNIKDIAKVFKDNSNFLYLGRGINFPVALEGALKLKEISYAHAEGYPAAEMKHGPIALIDENMPVVFVATKNKLSKKILSNMQEVKARNGRIIAIVNNASSVEGIADFIIEVPETLNELAPVVNVIPLQLLAYYIADLRGLDVDKPRNLAKSVTVE